GIGRQPLRGVPPDGAGDCQHRNGPPPRFLPQPRRALDPRTEPIAHAALTPVRSDLRTGQGAHLESTTKTGGWKPPELAGRRPALRSAAVPVASSWGFRAR